jgi:hypothetical protein
MEETVLLQERELAVIVPLVHLRAAISAATASHIHG